MPFKIGPWELIAVLAIVLIIFGVGRLSEVGGALGRGIREFRKAASGGDESSKDKAGKKGEDGAPKEG